MVVNSAPGKLNRFSLFPFAPGNMVSRDGCLARVSPPILHTHAEEYSGRVLSKNCRLMYGHTYSKSRDQPDEVANPARGQLNREN